MNDVTIIFLAYALLIAIGTCAGGCGVFAVGTSAFSDSRYYSERACHFEAIDTDAIFACYMTPLQRKRYAQDTND